jgi:hypothetical protein
MFRIHDNVFHAEAVGVTGVAARGAISMMKLTLFSQHHRDHSSIS